jgi:predicted nucleic acid-binding protein
MGRLSGKLASYRLVGLDTSIFIYQFEDHLIYRPLASEILDGVERGKWEAVTSVITLMEIAVRPFQIGSIQAAREYEALLVNFPHLQILDLNRDMARGAAMLRAEFNLRPVDALQAAACLTKGCQAWVTNDRMLKRLQSVLEVIILDDYLAEQ